jgi:hypothetical protein
MGDHPPSNSGWLGTIQGDSNPTTPKVIFEVFLKIEKNHLGPPPRFSQSFGNFSKKIYGQGEKII